MDKDWSADWSERIQAVYPKRSGPSGWKGSRLMLAVRSAVKEHGWEVLLNGCQRYKDFAQESGKEGTVYVQTPERFIAERSFLEDFGYEAPKSRDEIAREEVARRDSDRLREAVLRGSHFGITQRPGESLGAFETRIRLAEQGHRVSDDSDSAGLAGSYAESFGTRVASIAGRMRVGK